MTVFDIIVVNAEMLKLMQVISQSTRKIVLNTNVNMLNKLFENS